MNTSSNDTLKMSYASIAKGTENTENTYQSGYQSGVPPEATDNTFSSSISGTPVQAFGGIHQGIASTAQPQLETGQTYLRRQSAVALPADVTGAHQGPGGVAWDVPAEQNKLGVVSAQPIDDVPRAQHDIARDSSLPSDFTPQQTELLQRLHGFDRHPQHSHQPGVLQQGGTVHMPQRFCGVVDQPEDSLQGHVGNRLFAFMETQGNHDGNFRWKDFKSYLNKASWDEERAHASWNRLDQFKHGYLSHSDFLKFCNEPANKAYVRQIEASLPGGTGLAIGDIAGMSQQLKSTGLDPTSELHDNSNALEAAGAVYLSNLAVPAGQEKSATAIGDRLSQFFNKGHIGNRLFTFLDEEDDKRSGVVTWGQLALLLTQCGTWDLQQAQGAWWTIDDKRTGSMTRSEFINFCELEQCRDHIQAIEADLTGATGNFKGKKITKEEMNVEKVELSDLSSMPFAQTQDRQPLHRSDAFVVASTSSLTDSGRPLQTSVHASGTPAPFVPSRELPRE